jgi:uncharacterized SAM-binding protein YcdF (DUF218 family)
VLMTVVIAIALLTAVTMRLFVWPTTDRVEDPDAVVLFVGGRGERLEKAVELVRQHNVDALVIPNGTDPTWPAANAICSEPQQFLVFCPTPQPDTTRGEARTIAELAGQEGWDRLAMVTSDYHMSRARLLLSRCFDGDVAVVRADSRLGPLDRAVRIAHEWVGLARARVIDRSC